MDGLKDWLFPTSRVEDVVKIRPRSLELFYRAGLNPWNDPARTVEALLREHGLESVPFLAELQTLPVPDGSSPWETLPCFFLIDFLTEDHRLILHSDLPAIQYLLDMDGPEEGAGFIRILSRTVAGFMDDLRRHLREEEDDIFPAMLRGEYSLRYKSAKEGNTPPVAGRLLAGARLFSQEESLKSAQDTLAAGISKLGGNDKENGIAQYIRQAVAALYERLERHAQLEMNVLFPMAARIERELATAEAALR